MAIQLCQQILLLFFSSFVFFFFFFFFLFFFVFLTGFQWFVSVSTITGCKSIQSFMIGIVKPTQRAAYVWNVSSTVSTGITNIG